MVMSSRWRALLTLSLILAGTVIAVASLYPGRRPDGPRGFDDFVFIFGRIGLG